MAKFTELKSCDDVPEVLRDAFIIRGYRPCGLSAKDAVLSCVAWMSNETVNVWTHLLPGLFFLVEGFRLLSEAASPDGDSVKSTHLNKLMLYMPLVSLTFAMALVMLTSSLAHCLSCLSPRARHTCFFCDYAAIGQFSVASGIAHFYYGGLQSSDGPTATGRWLMESSVFSPTVFAPAFVVIHMLAFVISCLTRHRWHRMRFLIRTLNYVVAFCANMTPSWARLFFGTTPVFGRTSLGYVFWQCTLNGMAAVANVVKVPERFFPGKFDIVGQSHQWMHVFLAGSLVQELRGLEIDLETRMSEFTHEPTIVTSVIVPILVVIATLVSVVAFRNTLQENGDLKKSHRD